MRKEKNMNNENNENNENDLIEVVNEMMSYNEETVPFIEQMPVIRYESLSNLKNKIDKIADYLSSVHVDEETLQTSRKLVARVRKAVIELDDKRKEIQREVNKPVKEFTEAVKDLTSRVEEAEESIRVQIRELENNRRIEKKEKIRDIFEKRIVHYPQISPYVDFEDFYKNTYSNKSFSVKKVESEMVEWLENKDKDFQSMYAFCDIGNINLEDVIMVYKNNGLNVSSAITHIQKEMKEREQIAQEIKQAQKAPRIKPVQKYVLYRVKQEYAQDIEDFLYQSHIPYTKQNN